MRRTSWLRVVSPARVRLAPPEEATATSAAIPAAAPTSRLGDGKTSLLPTCTIRTATASSWSSGLRASAGAESEEVSRALPGEQVEDERVEEGDHERAPQGDPFRVEHVDHGDDQPERGEREREVVAETAPSQKHDRGDRVDDAE